MSLVGSSQIGSWSLRANVDAIVVCAGPAERLLNMLGEQNIYAVVYAFAFGINLVLCILLIPRYQLYDAAAALAIALVAESLLLFILSKRRLALYVLVFGR